MFGAAFVAALLTACHDDAPPAPIDTQPVARVCPTHLDMELIGSESRFNPGSSGTAHGVGLATGSQINVEIFDCDDECRRCKFHGPVRGDPVTSPVVSQRCLNDLATICSTDADCAGTSGPCRFVFPPITSKVVLASCTLAYFEPISGPDPSPVQGVVDLFTGESDLPVLNLNIAVQLSASPGAPNGACVDCLGDPQPFDGVRGGTCEFGGQACDVNGIGTVLTSTTSYDCAPPPDPFINIALPAGGTSTASKKWTLDATRPLCTKAGASTTEPCWCGVCNDGLPCIANGDCATGTCGFAGSAATPVNVNNNACNAPNTCLWDDTTQTGHCSNSTVSCYPEGVLGQSMTATGIAEVHDGFFISQLANLVCLPAFDGGFLDSVAGFPGPFLFESRFRVSQRGAQ